ncbi:MAG TPA: helix-turn-helix transcriptional regulator [Acidobacteriaceae bacterium]
MFENPEHAFGGARPMLSVIEQIYAAVQQPTLWADVMEGIAEAVQGESTSLMAQLPSGPLFSMARTDPAALTSYVTHYASINVMSARCDEIFPDGAVRYGDRAMPEEQLIQTEFYNDFFKRHSMHYTMGLKIPLHGLPSAYLTCQRQKPKGAFQECEGLVYETLLPHLQRALTLHGQLTKMQSSHLGMETALDAHEHAVFGLNREGRVIFSNRQAESIARTADALSLANGSLSSVFPTQNRLLQALLSDAVAVGAGRAVLNSRSSLLLPRKSEKKPLQLTVTPLVSQLPGSSAQLAALVFVSDPDARPQSRAAILRSLYALTPTEARVADSLLHGLETREIAEELGLTLETARFHIKRILSKTGTHRQTELMRLMLSLPLHSAGSPATRI